MRDGGVPGARVGGGPGRQAERALLLGEERRAAADVGDVGRAQRLTRQTEQRGRPTEGVDGARRGGRGEGARRRAVRAVLALGRVVGEERAVDEVHRAVAAVGVVLAGVALPAGLAVGHRLEDALRDAELARRRGEGRLAGGRARGRTRGRAGRGCGVGVARADETAPTSEPSSVVEAASASARRRWRPVVGRVVRVMRHPRCEGTVGSPNWNPRSQPPPSPLRTM